MINSEIALRLGQAANFDQVLSFLERFELEQRVEINPETSWMVVCALSELLKGVVVSIKTYIGGFDNEIIDPGSLDEIYDPVEIMNLKARRGQIIFDVIPVGEKKRKMGRRNFGISGTNEGEILFRHTGIQMSQKNDQGKNVIWEIMPTEQ